MGYGRFTKKEEELMEVFYNHRYLPLSIEKDYPHQIKSLRRRWFIKKVKDKYVITRRGESAIIQQIKTGSFWVAPLKTYKSVYKSVQEI